MLGSCSYLQIIFALLLFGTRVESAQCEWGHGVSLRKLRQRFRGDILLPGNVGYDSARQLWNARFDKKPSVIAKCSEVLDVVKIVRFAWKSGLAATVRSGSHDLSGRSVMNNELSIDLSLMKNISVDRSKGTVVVQAGVRWKELQKAVQAEGFAVGGPMDSNVTVSGYGLGGGLNLLMRLNGLACDNIVSLDVVTAAGKHIRVNERRNQDLFWAMRGAGANFGVVTSIEYQMYPIRTVLAGNMVWNLGASPRKRAREILRFLRDYNLNVPDAVSTFTYLLRDATSGLFISIWMCYTGDIATGEKVLRPLRNFGSPVTDDVREIAYEEQQTRVDFVAPDRRYYYYRTELLKMLDNATLDTLVDYYVRSSVPDIFIILEHFGGAIARVPDEASAFAGRDADYCVLFGAGTNSAIEIDRLRPVIRNLRAAMAPFATGRAYINYLDSDELERVPSAYGLKRYKRLQAVKKRYDPNNIFKFSQSITPAH